MTTERKDDFGPCRASGPADGLHEIASVINFVETAMRSNIEYSDDSLIDHCELKEAMHRLLYMCHLEINRIAEVAPISVNPYTRQAVKIAKQAA